MHFTYVFEWMTTGLVNPNFAPRIGDAVGFLRQRMQKLIIALERDEFERHVGQTAYIYVLSNSTPADDYCRETNKINNDDLFNNTSM